MTAAAPNVLLIEDDEVDARAVARASLEPDAGLGVTRLHHTTSVEAGIRELALRRYDAILLDLNLPDARGVVTVERIRKADEKAPIVVLTSEGNHVLALEALRAGAQDYLVKNELRGSLLGRSIRYAIERMRISSENHLLQERILQLARHESLSLLAAGIGHELESVVDVIRANLLFTERDPLLSSHAAASLGAIEAAARLSAQLTEQLLVFAGSEPQLGPLEPRTLIESAARILDSQLPRELVFRISVPDDCPAIIGDSAELQRMIVNMVQNSEEAIGDACGWIEVAVERREIDAQTRAALTPGTSLSTNDVVSICVRDSGEGISHEARTRMFEPFFSTRGPGRGLGLAMVHGIARTHRAGLVVHSVEDVGTAIEFLAPVARPATGPRRDLP